MTSPLPETAPVVDADAWISRAARPREGEPTKRLTIDVPLSLHQRIKCSCALQGVNMADEIRELLVEKFPDKHMIE